MLRAGDRPEIRSARSRAQGRCRLARTIVCPRAAGARANFRNLPKRQQEVWNLLEERREIAVSELVELAETTAATVRKLEDRGWSKSPRKFPSAIPMRANNPALAAIVLNPAQAVALEKIKGWRMEPDDAEQTRQPSRPSTFLLHGVTGCGKTEIYLQAIAHALEQGKGAIVLVPEISLTPQTVERFKARFSSGKLQTLVAVLHSHLSAGERHDEWHKIRQGRARIVIGARSAIFAPVEPLGLIIVDEEHEHTYKQEEAPRYHARDVAIMRGQMENAVVVLGSATPSLESYYNCKRGKFTLLELPERVDDQKMPLVRVVDMRQASARKRARRIFSPQLKEAITQRLERQRADDFIFEPARLFHLAAMSEVRLRCELPELQRVAHLSSDGAAAGLPHLRPQRKSPARLPGAEMQKSGHPFRRHRHAKSRGSARQTFSQGAHQTHGRRHDETQGRLPPCARRFSRGQN